MKSVWSFLDSVNMEATTNYNPYRRKMLSLIIKVLGVVFQDTHTQKLDFQWQSYLSSTRCSFVSVVVVYASYGLHLSRFFFIAFSQFLRRKKTIANSYTDKAKQMPMTEKERERENSIPVMRFIDYIHTNVFSNE